MRITHCPRVAKLISISFVVIQSCRATNKVGLYVGSEYASGYSFILKADSTFEYKMRGHVSSDTSAGNYHLIIDTVYFNHSYDHYKSEVLPRLIPPRPKFAIWRNKKLYLFFHDQERLDKRRVLQFQNN